MEYNSIHPRLTVDEALIVAMNARPLNPTDTIPKGEFQLRLDNLMRHTTDSVLLCSIQTLSQKIRALSESEFTQLCRDRAADRILYPDNYQLPSY